MFESHQITLQCPKCRCKSYHRRRWLQTNPTLTCAQCGVKIVIKADDLDRSKRNANDLAGRTVSFPVKRTVRKETGGPLKDSAETWIALYMQEHTRRIY